MGQRRNTVVINYLENKKNDNIMNKTHKMLAKDLLEGKWLDLKLVINQKEWKLMSYQTWVFKNEQRKTTWYTKKKAC